MAEMIAADVIKRDTDLLSEKKGVIHNNPTSISKRIILNIVHLTSRSLPLSHSMETTMYKEIYQGSAVN